MRIIEQLGQVLAAIVGLRRAANDAQAVEVIVRETGQLLGVDLAALRSVSQCDALRAMHVARLSMPDASDSEWWVALAILLEEAADLHRRQDDGIAGGQSEQLASMALDQIPINEESAEALACLVAGADAAELLPTSLRTVLWFYCERAGAYAQAEDWLFDLVETELLTDNLVRRGAAFYQRLDGLTDEELTCGGLPRAEVQEGLEHLWDLASQDGNGSNHKASAEEC